ncbi:MAG: hypothetical protein NVSMB52_21640 [Chloroflexota bacterium]
MDRTETIACSLITLPSGIMSTRRHLGMLGLACVARATNFPILKYYADGGVLRRVAIVIGTAVGVRVFVILARFALRFVSPWR